ncbi:putative reverse transcriptase domain-containing protein, partial [Tanacetum coccineum]
HPIVTIPLLPDFGGVTHRADIPEITLPPQKRLGIDLGLRSEVGESSAAAAARPIRGRRADYLFVCTMYTEIRRQRAEEVGYGIRNVWVDLREAVEEVAPMTLEGVNTRVTDLAAVQEQDTQDIYALIGDTQDRQTHIYQRVETLVDDSQLHYETARLLDQEALVSRKAWGRSIEAADRRSQTVTSEMLQAYHMRQAEIAALRAFDRTRQEQLVQTLTLMQSLQGQVTTLQGQVTALQGQQGPSRGPAQPVMIDQGVIAALAARDATRNGDDSHTSRTGVRRTERVAREYTYQDFMKCQHLYFKGTEGVVELTQLFERMETVFRISNCSVDNQIKFSTCTLLADLRKKMTDKYCPRNEMKKLEGSVLASKPKTMQKATEMESELMDKKINTITERSFASVNLGSNQRGNGIGQGPTCFECGVRGHFKTDCPKLKNNNNNCGNQVRNANALVKVYAVGHAGTNPNSNVVTEDGNWIIGFEHMVYYEKGEASQRRKDFEIVPHCPKFSTMYFLQDLHGYSSSSQGSFKLDLGPGVARVARAPYRWRLPK